MVRRRSPRMSQFGEIVQCAFGRERCSGDRFDCGAMSRRARQGAVAGHERRVEGACVDRVQWHAGRL